MGTGFKQKRQLPRLISVLLLAVLVVGMLPLMTAKADVTDGSGTGADIGSTVISPPSDLDKYIDATVYGRFYIENGYLYLRWRDAIIPVMHAPDVPGMPSETRSVYFALAWNDGSAEYVETIYSSNIYSSNPTLLYDSGDGMYSVYGVYSCFIYKYNSGSSELEYVSSKGTSATFDTKVTEKSWHKILPVYACDVGYVLYCGAMDYCYDGNVIFPITAPQPNNYMYTTTFRTLTEGSAVYNTYYYDFCYAAGDCIRVTAKANTNYPDGRKPQVVATRYGDGAATVTTVNNPADMCYISYYGTAYDIAYTNDDTLCELLGISMPERYEWDVESQAWIHVASWPSGGDTDTDKDSSVSDIIDSGAIDFSDVPDTNVINSDGTSPFDSADDVPVISTMSVTAAGTDETVSYDTYDAYYGTSLMHIATSSANYTSKWGIATILPNLVSSTSGDAEDCWNYGSRLKWTLSSGGSSVKLQVVAKITVQTASGTTASHQIIMQDYDGTHPGNNDSFSIAASDGSALISLYDLIIALEDNVSTYVRNPPAKLISVKYYLTPFYYSNGTYYRANTASMTHSINKTFYAVSVDDSALEGAGDSWDSLTDGTMWEAISSLGSYIKQSIANGISAVGSFFSGVLNSAQSMLNNLGSIPSLMSELFGFLPDEFLAAVGVGLNLWLLPSLLGLARTGLKALGGVCSTLFGFISTFFGG